MSAAIGGLGPQEAAIHSAAAGPRDTDSGGRAVVAGVGKAGIDRDADESDTGCAKRRTAAGQARCLQVAVALCANSLVLSYGFENCHCEASSFTARCGGGGHLNLPLRSST